MPDIVPLPADYSAWLTELKSRVHTAQQRATLAVNRELALLYWQIGRDILERRNREGWGAEVIERLAQDLRDAFPDMKGFSPRNLKCMRTFAEAWPGEPSVQGVLAHLLWYHHWCDASASGHDRSENPKPPPHSRPAATSPALRPDRRGNLRLMSPAPTPKTCPFVGECA